MMGGGGWDWQDREHEREKAAKEYYESHTCSLDGFTDKQLRDELTKRKGKKLKEAQKVAARAALDKANEPILAEIERLKKRLK